MNYIYEEISAIHLELTSLCNLKCPQCARTKDGQILPDLPLSHLSLNTIEKIFNEMGKQVKYVHICGNYGDFILYPKPLEAIDLIYQSGVEFIKVYTNGSGRGKEFWLSLGQRLTENRGQVVFSIDGLEDTNHLYRVGSNWQTVIDSAKIFINAGGNAVWEWLPFEHNDHQIDNAISMAKEIGFSSIILKKNPRFSPLNNGTHHTLKPSTKLVHKGIQTIEGMQPTLFPIRCKYKARKMIYIDFQGYLLPCCWHGNLYKGKNKFNDMYDIFKTYGFENFDTSKKSIRDILNHDWYTKAMDYTIKILPTCRKHCTVGAKMSNIDNRIVHEFKPQYDPEPWEQTLGL